MAGQPLPNNQAGSFSPEQRLRIVALGDPAQATGMVADFNSSTLLTFRLTPTTPVTQLANEFLYRTGTISSEERPEVLAILGGYAKAFFDIHSSVKDQEEYGYKLRGASDFNRHISAMKDRVVAHSRDNEPKVAKVRQFLSYVILKNMETPQSLSKTG